LIFLTSTIGGPASCVEVGSGRDACVVLGKFSSIGDIGVVSGLVAHKKPSGKVVAVGVVASSSLMGREVSRNGEGPRSDALEERASALTATRPRRDVVLP